MWREGTGGGKGGGGGRKINKEADSGPEAGVTGGQVATA